MYNIDYETQKDILFGVLIESGAMPEKYLDIVCDAFGYNLNTLQRIYYAIYGEEYDFDDNDF